MYLLCPVKSKLKIDKMQQKLYKLKNNVIRLIKADPHLKDKVLKFFIISVRTLDRWCRENDQLLTSLNILDMLNDHFQSEKISFECLVEEVKQ